MPTRSYDELGPLQQEIMAVVWDLGGATVQQVRDALGAGHAYTTVLSGMQKLEKLGWLRHTSEGRTYVYSAKRPWKRESQKSLRGSLEKLFRGDRALLLQQLIADDDVTDDELLALRRLIQDRRKELKP